jgi:hypothetical protein
MSKSRLAPLHQRKIAVDLEIHGRQVHFTGTATYDRDPQLGPILKIQVPDPAGEFDLILREDRFQGPIAKATEPGCDYHISLTGADLCTQPP